MSTSQDLEPGGWLSPSSAARLLACPASITSLPEDRPAAAPAAAPTSAGSFAHLAVQRWIEVGDWLLADPPAALKKHLSGVLAEHGTEIGTLLDGRLTEARLQARAHDLAQAFRRLAGDPAQIRSEVVLQAQDSRIWGIADVLMGSDQLAVLDLKTSVRSSAGEHGPHIQQLILYAAMVHAETRRWPATLAVFSLRHGYQQVPYEPRDARYLTRRAVEARARWAAGQRAANPRQDRCTYCPRRLSCDPHWEAAAHWDDATAAEGTATRVQRAKNGRTAVELSTASGQLWVTHLTITSASLDLVGKHVRAIFLAPSQRSADGSVISVRASERTQVAVY